MDEKRIEYIIKKSITNFNLVSSKDLQIKNVQKFKFSKTSKWFNKKSRL